MRPRTESARFYRDPFEMAEAPSWGPFSNGPLDGGVLLQYAEPPVEIGDAALRVPRRRRRRALADPQLTRPDETNTEHGGRGVYFLDPAGHGLEMITGPFR